MSRTILAVLIIAIWVGLTTAAGAMMPERKDPESEGTDLAQDIQWLGRVRPDNPPMLDLTEFPIPTTTTTTTTTIRYTTPPPIRRTTTTRPPPKVTIPRVPNTGGVEQWRSLVAQYPWPVDLMLSIMRCESGGRAGAINSIGAAGLFQHYPTPLNWQDPATNVALAYSKWASRGTQPWNASRSCWG